MYTNASMYICTYQYIIIIRLLQLTTYINQITESSSRPINQITESSSCPCSDYLTVRIHLFGRPAGMVVLLSYTNSVTILVELWAQALFIKYSHFWTTILEMGIYKFVHNFIIYTAIVVHLISRILYLYMTFWARIPSTDFQHHTVQLRMWHGHKPKGIWQ